MLLSDLQKKQGYVSDKLFCAVCGKEIEKSGWMVHHPMDPLPPLCKDGCFYTHFWLRNFLWRNDPAVARIEGVHYVLGEEDAVPRKGPGRGFGGSRLKIRFNDGREVESTNLWCQGDIPEEWRAVMPDNAVFVKI